MSTWYDREFVIDCCKDGTLTVRTKAVPAFNGAALPVFTTDTAAQAAALVVLLAKAQYGEHPLLPGLTWYRLSDFGGEVEDLAKVSELMNSHYWHTCDGVDDDDRPLEAKRVTCGDCERSWCERCDPCPSALCHWCHGRGCSTAPLEELS